jgi:hypothetical protein
MNNPHPRSVAGVAARHGVCRATIYNEIKYGRLEITKIGSRTIITEEQEHAWLNSRSSELCAPRGKKSA